MTKQHTPRFNDLKQLGSLHDVAKYLEVESKTLAYALYGAPGGRDGFYIEYKVPKKRPGEFREIAAPTQIIKTLQKRLSKKLYLNYQVRPSAHAYVIGRSIVTNAKYHQHKRFVFNIDLKDFFPSINFGRVRGLLMAKPYEVPETAATILTQICCYKDYIPQGAPTSPIISNMICSKLDGELQRLAKESKCIYTRYADDITFSTNLNTFPSAIATIHKLNLAPSQRLEQIIKSNGFSINKKKTRLQDSSQRQVVTGLVVNEKANVTREYVRNLRTAIFKWQKNGIQAASDEYYQKYQMAFKNSKVMNFSKVTRGRIEFLKMARQGQEDSEKRMLLYYKFMDLFFDASLRDHTRKTIRTEGKTDWMHLKAAYEALLKAGQIQNLDLEFHETKDHLFYGSKKMLTFCRHAQNGKIHSFKEKIVCLFDRDEKDITKLHPQNTTVSWGANVFSLTISNPNNATKNCAIEQLFRRQDMKSIVIEGRTLFSSDEFHPNGIHISNPSIKYAGSLDHLKGDPKILDAKVMNIATDKNIALSKYAFAKAIQKADLTSFDLSLFKAILVQIAQI